MKNSSCKTINRRALIIGLPTVALLFTPTFANADMGGGGNTAPSGSGLRGHYTQNQFLKLVSSEYSAGMNSRKVHLVGSFTGPMSHILFVMAYSDRRATQRLMRDMEKLKTRTARVKRLNREVNKTQKQAEALKASIKRLKAKSGVGAKLAVKSEQNRLKKTQGYLNSVSSWRNHPTEGMK